MATQERFVLAGLSRLAVRVAQLLVDRDVTVVVAALDDDELLPLLPEAVVRVTGHRPWASLLREAQLEGSECLLILSEDDLENLQIVTAASDAAPSVPVVLRAFDASLVEQFQFGVNVRRCYSSSALAAPAFVGAVLAESVVETLRLADAEVPLCILPVAPGSPLVGLTPGRMKADWGCAAIARTDAAGSWQPALGDGGPMQEGERMLVGGLLPDVLQLAFRNSHVLGARRRRLSVRSGGPRVEAAVPAGTFVAWCAAALVALFVVTATVFAVALGLGPVDAAYKALTNAFGDVGLEAAPEWVKIFGVSAMVLGAVLVGVVLAYVTALLTASHLEQQAGRRARKMRGHVVIAGLGMLGFRIDRLLAQLGIDRVIIEREEATRFREAAAFHTPVLSGDARLGENLERAGIRHATCLVACTDNDLVNVTACVEAMRCNPGIRTVARIFDDDLADRLGAFGIDVSLSMSRTAAGAFVGAATDERAVRHVRLDAFELVAFRHKMARPADADEVRDWRGRGLRILAVQHGDEAPQPPTAAMDGLPADAEIIVAGPEGVVAECLFSRSASAR